MGADATHHNAPPLLDGVVAHALSTELHDIPRDAIDAARILLADCLAVGQAGRSTDESAMALHLARADEGTAQATVWAGGPTLPAGAAALVNAHQVHTLEWDAIHEPAVVHPLTVVVPTLLAWAERESDRGRTITGEQLLRAVVVGVNVAAGLGRAATSAIRFFRPAVCGGMGAVAALVAADRPRPNVARAAFGIAYGAVSGTMQPHTEGAQVLALQCGLNARAALTSYDAAGAGFVGPQLVLEGPYGWFHVIEEAGDPEAFVSDLGRRWEVLDTSIKPYPSGRATHGALAAVLDLQREYGFTVDDVASVDAAVPPLVHRLVGRPAEPGMPVGAARLSLPYLVPHALRDRTVNTSTYSDERLAEAGTHGPTVTVIADGNPDPNAFGPQTVTLTLTDGTSWTRTLEASPGSRQRPLDAPQRRAKIRECLVVAGRPDPDGDADAMLDVVGRIERLPDVRVLLELL